MKTSSLFRPEAVESRQHGYHGTVSINTPLHYQIVIAGVVVAILGIILFLSFAQFSEKFIVKGYVNSTKGVVGVFPSKNGIIVHSRAIHGAHVNKGDELFMIDTSYDGLFKNKQHDVLIQLKNRKASIKKEINYKKSRLAVFKTILDKKYISQTMFDSKYGELVALQNNKRLLEMELIKYKQERAYRVRAPISGIISTIIYKQGQYTNTAKPLLKILPDNADLIAEIFVPINQAGFLNTDNKILIRYDAYPYEHFGTYGATLQDISQSILTDDEEEKPIKVGTPYYKVTAALAKESVTLYGHDKKITNGMTFSAVIVGEKRKIWQWILDPIYSYSGGLFS